MAKTNKSKLKEAMDEALFIKPKSETLLGTGYFNEDDLLKHYIRKNHWKKRIESLKRDCKAYIPDGIKYFTFCSRLALDIRYFARSGLLDFKSGSSIPFTFVEFLKGDYDFLIEQFIKRYPLGMGFYGSLSDISTNTNHKYYGKFWSTFPFDVINLDYLGDIFKSTSSSGKIGVNDFYAIQAIVSKQSFLRRPYELWITMRAKPGRYDPSIKNEFRQLLKHNIDSNPKTFGKRFAEIFLGSVNSLTDDELFIIGYLKWLWYVCNNSFSTINTHKLKVIKYGRIDKDGEPYFLYNIFLRIEPYDQIVVPSPASSAAKYCQDEYENGIKHCFAEPIDITDEFNSLSKVDKLTLKNELEELNNEYLEDEKGWIS